MVTQKNWFSRISEGLLMGFGAAVTFMVFQNVMDRLEDATTSAKIASENLAAATEQIKVNATLRDQIKTLNTKSKKLEDAFSQQLQSISNRIGDLELATKGDPPLVGRMLEQSSTSDTDTSDFWRQMMDPTQQADSKAEIFKSATPEDLNQLDSLLQNQSTIVDRANSVKRGEVLVD